MSLAAGCVESDAPFLVADRPMVQLDGKSVYLIHIGDRPLLRFGGRSTSPDYAVIRDDGGRYEDAGLPFNGVFEWRRTFDVTSPDDTVLTLEARGYRQNQHRDFMPVEGQLQEADLAFDAADELVATGTLHIRVYQSRIVVDVPPREGGVDWSLSWLDLKTADGRRTRLRYSSARASGGFTVMEDEATGGWRVEYEPTLDEIDPAGPTHVALNVADLNGRPTKIEQTFLPH